MKEGDAVFVTADNYGAAGVVVAVRDDEPRWLIRTDSGEHWFFTYEVSDDKLRQPRRY